MTKIEVFNLQDGKELHVIQNRTNILMELHNWPENIEGQHLRGWIELNFQKQDDERYYQVIKEMANKVLKSVNLICKISVKLLMYFVILYNILHRRGYNGRQHYYIGRKTSNKSK